VKLRKKIYNKTEKDTATTFCQLLFKLCQFICDIYDRQRAIYQTSAVLCCDLLLSGRCLPGQAVNFISLVEVADNGQCAILLAGNVARDRIT